MDLRQKMIVASVDVKESIMSMELMQDKQHETTALLVNKEHSELNLLVQDLMLKTECR